MSRVGEHTFLADLCHRLDRGTAYGAQEVPPGDDAAVIDFSGEHLVATTDSLVEDVHFRSGWLSPAELGKRAAVANLSDLSAMGATPKALLLALVLPTTMGDNEIEELTLGVAAAAEGEQARLVGGNLSRGASLGITITALGDLEGPALVRSGAKPDDLLVVTGTLGDAAAAVSAWENGSEPSPPLRESFANPRARVRAGQVLAQAGARAAIDVSDGLVADLGHLCRASGVGAHVERDNLPRSRQVSELDAAGNDFAANGGEDYELLVVLPRAMDTELAKLAGQCSTSLSVIGRTTTATGQVVLTDTNGRPYELKRRGFDHFAREDS